jgi:hypothetical protein
MNHNDSSSGLDVLIVYYQLEGCARSVINIYRNSHCQEQLGIWKWTVLCSCLHGSYVRVGNNVSLELVTSIYPTLIIFRPPWDAMVFGCAEINKINTSSTLHLGWNPDYSQTSMVLYREKWRCRRGRGKREGGPKTIYRLSVGCPQPTKSFEERSLKMRTITNIKK